MMRTFKKEIIDIIDRYKDRKDWKVKENSNSPYSYGALNKYIVSQCSNTYWDEVYKQYDPSIISCERNNYFHIHDKGGLTLYCSGYSLQTILMKGVTGVPNIPKSKPAKHFDAILNQLANLVTIFQNEIMGAVAFSSFDTLLAPFVAYDNLSYEEVKQCLQNYIYSVNSNSRAGAEPAFSNLTFDLFCPPDLRDQEVIIGGLPQEGVYYKQFQKEIDIINKAFFDVMLEGDADGKPFAYPIPTYSIMKGFDWDNPNNEKLWEMTGKYGYPYFSNYLNSDMEPSDVRSMCCRLRLDLTELRRKNGGLFGAGDSTGSIGVVTINLPRIAYEANGDKAIFFDTLEQVMEKACVSLEAKRAWLNDNIIGTGMIPAFDEYVGSINNYFSTIGFVGMNEMCENLIEDDIQSAEGIQLSIDVLNFMRDKLIEFQQNTGHLYNLEATPAESTCYKLALKDVSDYPDIITQGTKETPYYTNSCHIPVKDVFSVNQLLQHQDHLQTLLTGGTVAHLFMGHGISGSTAKHIVRTACENYSLPYISIAPLICICEECGVIQHPDKICPSCGKETRLYQKITGYTREVKNFNDGKYQEFLERTQYSYNPKED